MQKTIMSCGLLLFFNQTFVVSIFLAIKRLASRNSRLNADMILRSLPRGIKLLRHQKFAKMLYQSSQGPFTQSTHIKKTAALCFRFGLGIVVAILFVTLSEFILSAVEVKGKKIVTESRTNHNFSTQLLSRKKVSRTN